MDIGSDFLLLAIVFMAIRLFYYSEKSLQLVFMELISAIFMMFAIYFLLVPYYNISLNTTTISNVPACTSSSCTYVTEMVNSTTQSQTRPNPYPQFYLGFFAAVIYAVIVIFWTIKDITSLYFVREEEDEFNLFSGKSGKAGTKRIKK